jgi:hypothetical protein
MIEDILINIHNMLINSKKMEKKGYIISAINSAFKMDAPAAPLMVL